MELRSDISRFEMFCWLKVYQVFPSPKGSSTIQLWDDLYRFPNDHLQKRRLLQFTFSRFLVSMGKYNPLR